MKDHVALKEFRGEVKFGGKVGWGRPRLRLMRVAGAINRQPLQYRGHLHMKAAIRPILLQPSLGQYDRILSKHGAIE